MSSLPFLFLSIQFCFMIVHFAETERHVETIEYQQVAELSAFVSHRRKCVAIRYTAITNVNSILSNKTAINHFKERKEKKLSPSV